MTLTELRERLDELVLVDVRTEPEYEGVAGAPCDPRHGHIPGAVNVPLERILACRTVGELQQLVGAPEGTEVVLYCHTGNRSAYAAQVLDDVGYRARNYVGSWHEWSRHDDLPAAPAR